MRKGAKQLLLSAALCALAAPAAAQAPRPDDVRGSPPPGTVDGAKPSDGAIQGGSILPGETGGRPDPGRGPTTPGAGRASRCDELTGSLRDQCLLDEQRASSGAGRAAPSDAAPGAPPADPPPQRPR